MSEEVQQPQEVEPAPENVTSLTEGVNRPSAVERKKMQMYQERRKRLLNKGVPPDQVDMVMAKEDWDRLSIEEKLRRSNMAHQGAMQQAAQEMQNLRHNDGVLAEAMDVNFRAITKILVKLGVTLEDQKTVLAEAQKELQMEFAARKKAQEDQQAAAMAQAQVQADMALPGEPPPPPSDATVFEG